MTQASNPRMSIESSIVRFVRPAGDGIFIAGFDAPSIARSIQPAQFLNIRVTEGSEILLRRPFSVYHVEDDTVEIIFNVVGRGTATLSRKRPGDVLDVLGPLGHGFDVHGDDFESAILIGGGLGVAPLPMTVRALRSAGKHVVTVLGARTASMLVTDHLEGAQVATDDGSRGFHGTVVQLAQQVAIGGGKLRPAVFACGPTPMLRAVAEFARAADYRCQVSLEGAMGCGIGICQGCPVRRSTREPEYALMCKDGPVFDVRDIVI